MTNLEKPCINIDNFRQISLLCYIGPFYGKLNFLIDSGAEISLIKSGKILDLTTLIESPKLKLVGISSDSQHFETIGSCEIQVEMCYNFTHFPSDQ